MSESKLRSSRTFCNGGWWDMAKKTAKKAAKAPAKKAPAKKAPAKKAPAKKA